MLPQAAKSAVYRKAVFRHILTFRVPFPISKPVAITSPAHLPAPSVDPRKKPSPCDRLGSGRIMATGFGIGTRARFSLDFRSDFKTSRHYLASVPPHTLPAPLRG
jgi:hypothetical protein